MITVECKDKYIYTLMCIMLINGSHYVFQRHLHNHINGQVGTLLNGTKPQKILFYSKL